MDLQLDGRVALVTGGSSGVGVALVELLLSDGMAVATCGRDPERADAALSPLADKFGGQLLWRSCDVTDRAQVERLVADTVSTFGRLDSLVNNAGASRVSTFAGTSDDDWRDELDLKFGSIINTVHACRPHLAESGAGAIVNVNSILARQPEPHLVATSAARAGVLNLSRSLATELADDGIRVNTVALGLIDTGQWRRRYDAADTTLGFDEWSAQVARDRGITLGRFGRAEEAASMIAVLLSPRSSYVTGACVDVGGGVNRYV